MGLHLDVDDYLVAVGCGAAVQVGVERALGEQAKRISTTLGRSDLLCLAEQSSAQRSRRKGPERSREARVRRIRPIRGISPDGHTIV